MQRKLRQFMAACEELADGEPAKPPVHEKRGPRPKAATMEQRSCRKIAKQFREAGSAISIFAAARHAGIRKREFRLRERRGERVSLNAPTHLAW
jgi:hypothetical protein